MDKSNRYVYLLVLVLFSKWRIWLTDCRMGSISLPFGDLSDICEKELALLIKSLLFCYTNQWPKITSMCIKKEAILFPLRVRVYIWKDSFSLLLRLTWHSDVCEKNWRFSSSHYSFHTNQWPKTTGMCIKKRRYYFHCESGFTSKKMLFSHLTLRCLLKELTFLIKA